MDVVDYYSLILMMNARINDCANRLKEMKDPDMSVVEELNSMLSYCAELNYMAASHMTAEQALLYVQSELRKAGDQTYLHMIENHIIGITSK